ncbi:TonB-dependent receptor [Sphingomonas oryzagri]|uniref:TonB-dependent receptor n=1 Tax=Sphingomonas oryzagri TaxID=3042314 RepID=A0ABT6MXN8_9SPHN|nr:TonB-dependent receptor [Sphingomonas oryzagri]MDH7637249.1 TonB-dependent receptor [Sphingomonas oryzagri]
MTSLNAWNLRASRLLLGCSALAVFAAGNANAQTAAPASTDGGASAATPADAIVVTGVRASLQSAQNIKRNSSQIVDSIVAEDIGKLPDRNIAESLQRISGIQIQRQYGEGSSVQIRGLTQVRTELNGRDIFTASAAGEGTSPAGTFSLEDMPSELLAGIDVYKNPSSDLIEDQLSGTINLRTRKPFDFNGFKIAASVGNTYYDLVKKSKPSASLLVSDRWDTGIGEIGVLVSASYQRTAFRQDTISTEPFNTLDTSLKSDGTPNNPADYAAASTLGRLDQTTTLAHGTGIGEVYGDRRRFGLDASVQWKPTDTLELTGEVFRNDYKFRFDDYSYFAEPAGAQMSPEPGAAFTFAPNGDVISGTYNNIALAANTSLETRHSRTTDYSLNAKWKPTDRLTITADGQYVDAKTQDVRSIIGLNGVGDGTLVQDISGSTPAFSITTPEGVTNPASYNAGFYLDDLNHARAKDKAVRLDAEYKFDGLLQSIKAGFRYADRSNVFSDTGYRYVGLATAPTDTEVVDLGDFFHGDASIPSEGLFFSRNTTLSYSDTLASLGISSPATYLPSGTSTQSQKTYAGYVAAFFKADQLPVPIDGNVGVRFVRTQQAVTGYYQQTDLITASDGSQSTGATTSSLVDFANSYNSWLPSLNLRAHLTDKLQLRFAASKNISRPSLSQLNPALTITEPGKAQINQEHDTTGGNPYLKPMKSTNLDVSAEWYFSRTGSLTAAGFYKDIKNYIQTGISARDVTFSDGVTATYNVTSYSNAADAKVKGFELSYQQFFDFLPGALKGLGLQANFTYVDSKAPSPATEGPVHDVSLEGLSKYNYNIVGIYERGKISARLAYNWRSQFLVTTSGNGSGNLPVFEKPFGQMDASITFNVTPHFALTLNGVNLLNTMTSTYYGIKTRPRDAIVNDRQISGVAKITF